MILLRLSVIHYNNVIIPGNVFCVVPWKAVNIQASCTHDMNICITYLYINIQNIFVFLIIAYFTTDVIGEPLTNRKIRYIKVFGICPPVEVAVIVLTTFGLRDTTTTMSPPDITY